VERTTHFRLISRREFIGDDDLASFSHQGKSMKKLLAAAVLSAFALPVFAVGTFIPAPSRKDMVHDEARGLIYISDGSQILRYQVSTGTFLSPVDLGGSLVGLDISPDGRTLAVADSADDATTAWVHLIDLDTLSRRRLNIAVTDSYEGGTFSVAYALDGKIYSTSGYHGSATVPLRRLDPATDTATVLASVGMESMLSASGDGLTIAFAEHNNSSGPWGIIDVPTGTVVRNRYPGTGWHNYEIATDRFGAQFAIPTYGGTFVYDDAYAKIASFGAQAGVRPIGVAYHPVERIAYFPIAQTSEVRVFDMNSVSQSGSLDFEDTFLSMNNNTAFLQGRTRLSRDGSLLMVSVTGGVRVYQQYASLQANPVFTSTNRDVAKAITLAGSIGNNGALSYSVGSAPVHGAVSIVGNTATYTPSPGYVGSDAFTYRVSYGQAVRSATVSVTMIDTNRPPVATDDAASTRNTAILIPVLANDSDPDGDALSIVSLTAPTAGTAIIQGTKVLFTPPKKWPAAPVTFNYTISDGHGKSASAKVTVTRN
jgi:hypothetical protein